MQTADEQEFKQLQRHPHFYLNCGDLHFLLNNQLFRVHRYFFERESRKFRDVILTPSSTEGLRQGDTDSTAIVLDVAVQDFEMLLGIFYNPKYSIYDWTISHWTQILTLAHEWEFGEVKNLAIRELEKMKLPVIDRIALYHRFTVDIAFLVPLYAVLCSRDEPLDEVESGILGLKTTVLVFRTRERLRAQPSDGSKSPLPSGLEKEYILDTIWGMIGVSTPASTPVEAESRSSNGEEHGCRGVLDTGTAHSLSRRINKNSNGRTGRVVGCQRKA